jgi:hypothetical protein
VPADRITSDTRSEDELVNALLDGTLRGSASPDGARGAGLPADAEARLREVVARHSRREAELEELYAAAQDLTRIRDVEHALRTVTDRTKRLLACDVAYLSASVEGAEHFAVRAWSGQLSPAFLGTRVSVGSGVGGAVAATRQPFQVEDYTEATEISHNEYLDSHVGGEGIRTLLGVPLEIDGRLLGILFAGRRDKQLFTEPEIISMTSLAAHAAVALDNAQLFEAQERTMQELERSTELLKAQHAAVETSVEVHERLTQLLLHGEGVGPIVAVVGEALGVSITFVDEGGVVLGRHGDRAPQPPFNQSIKSALDQSRHTGRSAQAAGPDGRHWYVDTAASGTAFLGSVLLAANRSLTDIEVRTFERATQTLSVSRLADAAMAEADTRASGEVIRRLLDPTRSSPEELDRVARRHQLNSGPITVAVAIPIADRAAAQLSAASALCRERGGLAGLYEDQLVVLVPGEPSDMTNLVFDRLKTAAGQATTVAGSGPAASPLDLQHLHRESAQCLTLMHQLGRAHTWGTTAEFGIYSMLFTAGSAKTLDHFVATQIGALIDYDERHGTRLVRTAQTYLEVSSSPSATAATLGIHANTVSQRIARIDRMLGPGWRESPRRLDVHMALRLNGLRGSTGADAAQGGILPPPE